MVDNPGSSFVLVVLFAIWRYFPYAFISFLAILQTIDKSLYEAADGWGECLAAFSYRDAASHHAGAGHGGHAAHHLDVLHVCGCLSAHHQGRHSGRISLQNRLAFNDLGKAAAISVVLFVIIFAVILLTRKRVNLNGNNKRVLWAVSVFIWTGGIPDYHAVFVMLMTSFKSAKEAISLHLTILPQEWTLQHYIDIFNPLIFRLWIISVTAWWCR